MLRPTRSLLAVALVALIGSSGCARVTGRQTVERSAPNTPAPSVTGSHPVPRPVHTVVRSFRTYPAGSTAVIQAQRGVSLRVAAARPTASRNRLSSSYGYPPAHGYYVTFRLTIVNSGAKPVDIGPADFLVRIAHEGAVTSYDGNSPYSGAARQLDTTELEPGEHVRAPLTFDVRAPHGRLDYRPGGQTVAAWTF